MKKSVFTLMIISGMMFFSVSCKNAPFKENSKPKTENSEVSPDLILIGRDIITEVVVRLDTIGDPWEVEKVKNYNGKQMFSYLFENIYSKKIIVYDILSGEPLDPNDVKKMEKEFGSDPLKITKIQFLEDWYFNPLTKSIIKKQKSVSFGYNALEDGLLSERYKPLFRLNTDQ